MPAKIAALVCRLEMALSVKASSENGGAKVYHGSGGIVPLPAE